MELLERCTELLQHHPHTGHEPDFCRGIVGFFRQPFKGGLDRGQQGQQQLVECVSSIGGPNIATAALEQLRLVDFFECFDMFPKGGPRLVEILCCAGISAMLIDAAKRVDLLNIECFSTIKPVSVHGTALNDRSGIPND